MRRELVTSLRNLVVVVAMVLAGCGDDTTTPTNKDLATVSDLSVAADLSTLSCANVLACVAGCGQNLVCQDGCRQSGTSAAQGLFNAFGACLVADCSPVDGGTKSCTGPTDTSAACRTCLANAAVQSMGVGGPCHSEYAACASM